MTSRSEQQPPDGLRVSLQAFVDLGLTLTEARAYVAMLRLPAATAAEISRAAGVPRPKVYDALRSLERRGFCAPSGDTVVRYVPVAPSAALVRWGAQREHERRLVAEQDERLIDQLVSSLPDGSAPAGEASDYMETVSGRPRTGEVLERVIGAAESTVCLMQQPPFVQARSRWNVAETAALERGVDVRIIFTHEAVRDERRYAATLEAGARLRVVDTVPMKLLVRDGVEALISLRDPLTGEQGLTSALIRHPDLVGPLELLFEREWERAEPLEASVRVRGGEDAGAGSLGEPAVGRHGSR